MFNNVGRIPMDMRQLGWAIAAGRVDPSTKLQAEQERKRYDERLVMTEMQRLAEWNARLVTIGGVQMTNEDAQRARRRFIENEDEYAERAVRHGLIRDGEQGDLKRTMRRKCDLEEREGRGIITADERREREALNRSRMGRAADEATANIHTGKGIALDTQHASLKKSSAANVDTLPNSRDIFQSTPVAQQAFAQAAQPVTEDIAPEAPLVAPLSAPVRQVSRTGLDL